MKPTSLHELKKELNDLSPAQVLDLTMRLAKHKKENKELLTYLLFDAGDEPAFIMKIKASMDEQFLEMNRSNVYLAKKTLRKILRMANKYIKFSGSPQTAVEVLGYFSIKLKKSGIPMAKNTVIGNMYDQQIKKINSSLSKMHEDLQYDYEKLLEELGG
jgi:vacuolar-type H+-ATPase catalytic subunit A/Vma1